MKNLLLVAILLMSIPTLMIAQDAETKNGPEITFESTTIDYGKIDQGSDGVRTFKFTNTGSEPLLILNARGSCGCTVPTPPKDPIYPGESSEIEVKYDTNRLGRINKTVTVTTNAGDPVRLRIAGEVLRKTDSE